jgi:hypothetical protein
MSQRRPNIPLKDLDASFYKVDYGNGLVLRALRFRCPKCTVSSGRAPHYVFIPFWENDSEELRDREGTAVRVYRRTSGDGLSGLTLEPAYAMPRRYLSLNGQYIQVPSCLLRGWVANGQWEWAR